WRAVAIPVGAISAVLTILYIAQVRTSYFKEWREEAGMNKLIRHLEADAAQTAKNREVTAGGTWILEYSTRYYGKRYRLPWLKVLDSKERETIRPDYYLFTRDEA